MGLKLNRDVLFISIEMLIVAGVAFGNVLYVLLLVPLALNRKNVYQYRRREKRINQLREAFIQQISYLSSALYAGFSVENSILQYAKRLKEVPSIDSQYEAFIENESKILQQGGNTQHYFKRMKEAYGLPEVVSFCGALEIGYQMGGPIAPVFKEAVTMTKSNYHTEKDIAAMIAEKRFEAAIISWMPYGVMLFLRFSMNDLMNPIFKSFMGVLFLQGMIIIFEFSSWLAHKICDIKLSKTMESP